MLNRVINILNGRILHWGNTNNVYIKLLIERAKHFPPKTEILLTQFSLASYLMSEELLGPDKGKNRIIKKDSKKVTAEQFKSLHNLHIWSFIALFCLQNSRYRKNILEVGKEFIDINKNEIEMIRLILSFKSMDNIDISQCTFTLFKKVCLILEYESKNSLQESLSFSPMLLILYSRAMKTCKVEWGISE